MLTYDLMIPLSVKMENKARKQRYKKEKAALLIEVLVPRDFGLNNAEIKKIIKYPDLIIDVKRTWKLKSAVIVPVIVVTIGMMKKNVTWILKTIPGNIMTNDLQLEAAQGLVTMLKKSIRTKTLRTRKLHKLVYES